MVVVVGGGGGGGGGGRCSKGGGGELFCGLHYGVEEGAGRSGGGGCRSYGSADLIDVVATDVGARVTARVGTRVCAACTALVHHLAVIISRGTGGWW